MNRVVLTGRITRDPELRYSQAGVAFISFSIAVDRQTRDASGARQADFINCVCFRSQAEFMSRYIKKGYMLAIEGSLQTRTYQAQDGTNRNVTEVICNSVENLTPRQNTQEMPRENTSPFPTPNNYQAPSYNSPSFNQDNDIEVLNIDDDDLPF